MTRDMDLIRDILLLVRAVPAGQEVGDFSGLTADRETVVEHVWLAKRDDLVDAEIAFGNQGPSSAIIWRLTPRGHDFIEHARQKGVWEQAKSTLAEKGVGFTIELLSRMMQGIALQRLGFPS
jgi:hypothetical protein